AAFPKPDLNGVALYEKTKDGAPRWVGVVLSSFGIVYNPSLYETLKLPPPQAWADLARPELAGLVALADPTRSGSAAVTYMMAVQRAMADAEQAYFDEHPDVAKLPPDARAKDAGYNAALAAGWKRGMRTLLLVAANGRYFTDAASQVPNDVGNADAAAGVAIDFYARVYQEQVGARRIEYVAPRGATAITPDPVAVLYGVTGDRGTLANRFVEFLLTPAAQRLWNLNPGRDPHVERSLRRMPVRRDVYADRAGWADDANPFEEAAVFNMRGEWMRLFGDTRPIWAAAWIDARATLKDAYDTVLRVPDAARRAALLAELSDLPIELADVDRQNRTRREMEQQKQDVRLWMTKQRIAWAAKFRDHYRAVASKAR
ncbi:MAG TPA: ABC transporter substrate-binding protein, partial [Tepidisphaeraceae bacterium]|nr:ABC transporter substrate-binding protein [Tepidisphaeraceae bacterium]